MNKIFIDIFGNTVEKGDFIIYSTGADRNSSSQFFGVVENIEAIKEDGSRGYRHKIRVGVIGNDRKWDDGANTFMDVGWRVVRRYTVRTTENIIKFPIRAIKDEGIRNVALKSIVSGNIASQAL